MATIKDIADAAGISIGTVDRIIHKRGRYSERTAEKVRGIMEELNYSPNIHARGLKKTKTYSFAAVLPEDQQDAGYWKMVSAGISRASAELTSFCGEVLVFNFDRYSEKSCLRALHAALSSGSDGLLIAPVLPEIMQPLLEQTEIPFLFIDTDIPQMKKCISFIGQDSYQSGMLSGKLMAMLLFNGMKAGKSDYVMIAEPAGSNFHIKGRIDGFRSFFDAHLSDLRLKQISIGTDDEVKFHAVLEEFFSSEGSRPVGIFAANSSVYYLASFLKKKGALYSGIPLIGYDLIQGQECLVEDETINFILTQQPEEQAHRGIMMLYDALVLNQEVRDELIIPLNIITKENLHTFRRNDKITSM